MLAAFARALLRPKRAVDCVGGEWALASAGVLRTLASTKLADGPLADFGLATLALVGVCDDGGDSPNRFFDPASGSGLAGLLGSTVVASPDLRADVRLRLGFGDEALADLEDVDGLKVELRDVAVLLVAHQVHEWGDDARGYRRRPRTRPWLEHLAPRCRALAALVTARRRASRKAARELLGALAGDARSRGRADFFCLLALVYLSRGRRQSQKTSTTVRRPVCHRRGSRPRRGVPRGYSEVRDGPGDGIDGSGDGTRDRSGTDRATGRGTDRAQDEARSSSPRGRSRPQVRAARRGRGLPRGQGRGRRG